MSKKKPNEKICLNCKHLLWMVGIGQGLRCGHPDETKNLKYPPIIPRRTHSCGLFEEAELKKGGHQFEISEETLDI